MNLVQLLTYPSFGAFGHAVSIAPFKDLDGTSGADSEILVNGQVQSVRRPCWADLSSLGGVKGELRPISPPVTGPEADEEA